ncbi:MAG: hypothetical protein ACHQ5A_12750 [Opitutales bacterium]
MNAPKIATHLALVAGGMDFLTGLGLGFAPEFTLRLMLVPPPEPAALPYLRFVGAFVGAVGAAYLWALGAPARLRTTLAVLVFPCAAAAGFTGLAVSLGALPAPWLSVTVTDLTLVAMQLWLLRNWERTG